MSTSDTFKWGLVRFLIEISERSYGHTILDCHAFPNSSLVDNPGESISDILDSHSMELAEHLENKVAGQVYEVEGELWLTCTSHWTDCGTEYDSYAELRNFSYNLIPEKQAEKLIDHYNGTIDYEKKDTGVYLSTNFGGSYLHLSSHKETEDKLFLEVGHGCFSPGAPEWVSTKKVTEVLAENWNKLIEKEPPVQDRGF